MIYGSFAEDLRKVIEDVLYKALPFLDNTKDISDILNTTLVAVILQLLATIVLFLIIRLKFWDKVTGIIEARQDEIAKSIKAKEDAQEEARLAKEEAEQLKKESRANANLIIEQAKRTSSIEAEAIINDAHKKIEQDTQLAKEALEKQRQEMQEGIKNEIVDVAYTLAEKMVEHEIDRDKNKKLVEDTISNLDNK